MAKNLDFEWGYWALDGTESTGQGRTYGSEETFGILNMTWNGLANTNLLKDLQEILDLKVNYNKEFQKVISNTQISKLYHAELEFRKKLLRRISKRNRS